MSSHEPETKAKDGLIILALSLALWIGMLAIFLGVGHLLAVNIMAGHH